MKEKHRWYGYVIFAAVLLAFIALYFIFPDIQKFADPEFLRNYLRSLGGNAYFIYVLLLLATIPLPIPSTPVVLAGGYVFGLIGGTLLASLGAIIGGTVTFYLTRIYGKPLLEKMVDKHHIKHFNHVFRKRGIVVALISFSLPLFPSDAVHALLGLTPIGYPVFLVLVIVGHIPRYLIVNSLGADLHAGFTPMTIIIIIAAIILVLVAAYRERLKKFFFKELRELEKEIGV